MPNQSVFQPCRLALALACGVSIGAAVPVSAQTYGPVDDPRERARVVSSVSEAGVVPQALPQPLVDAVTLSLDQNPQVLARLAELAALQADLRTARRLRFPNLSAEVLATTGGSNAADVDGLAINLALEQPIWTFGAISGQIDAARATRQSGYNALREARLEILIAVINAYYDTLLSQERIRVLEAGLAQYRELTASIERRVVAGVSPTSDLTLALSRQNQLEVELMSARELGEEARLRLIEFTGVEPDGALFPGEGFAEQLPDEAAALDDMMACAPTLDRLRSEVDVAQARSRTARADILPQLSLQLSQNEITGSRAAIVLRAETGNGLGRLSAIDAAEARVEGAIAQLGQADREMRTVLRREYVALRSSKRRAEAARQAGEAAGDLTQSYRRQFGTGRRSWLDLLNAAREEIEARLAARDAEVLAAGSTTRILALSCRWRPSGL